jgi:hypothetical protein
VNVVQMSEHRKPPAELDEAKTLNEQRVELEIQLIISGDRGKDDILRKINFIDDKLKELSKERKQ